MVCDCTARQLLESTHRGDSIRTKNRVEAVSPDLPWRQTQSPPSSRSRNHGISQDDDGGAYDEAVRARDRCGNTERTLLPYFHLQTDACVKVFYTNSKVYCTHARQNPVLYFTRTRRQSMPLRRTRFWSGTPGPRGAL